MNRLDRDSWDDDDFERDDRLVCHDSGSRRAVTLDFTRQTVTFDACHWPRKLLTFGVDSQHTCGFADIRTAAPFRTAGRRYLMITTTTGRCQMLDDWEGFDEVAAELRQIASETPAGSLMDQPYIFIPVMLVGIFAVVGVIIYFLL